MLQALAPLLGCGLMMLICAAVMGVAGARGRSTRPDMPPAPDEVSVLRAEVERLRLLALERDIDHAEDTAR